MSMTTEERLLKVQKRFNEQRQNLENMSAQKFMDFSEPSMVSNWHRKIFSQFQGWLEMVPKLPRPPSLTHSVPYKKAFLKNLDEDTELLFPNGQTRPIKTKDYDNLQQFYRQCIFSIGEDKRAYPGKKLPRIFLNEIYHLVGGFNLIVTTKKFEPSEKELKPIYLVPVEVSWGEEIVNNFHGTRQEIIETLKNAEYIDMVDVTFFDADGNEMPDPLSHAEWREIQYGFKCTEEEACCIEKKIHQKIHGPTMTTTTTEDTAMTTQEESLFNDVKRILAREGVTLTQAIWTGIQENIENIDSYEDDADGSEESVRSYEEEVFAVYNWWDINNETTENIPDKPDKDVLAAILSLPSEGPKGPSKQKNTVGQRLVGTRRADNRSVAGRRSVQRGISFGFFDGGFRKFADVTPSPSPSLLDIFPAPSQGAYYGAEVIIGTIGECRDVMKNSAAEIKTEPRDKPVFSGPTEPSLPEAINELLVPHVKKNCLISAGKSYRELQGLLKNYRDSGLRLTNLEGNGGLRAKKVQLDAELTRIQTALEAGIALERQPVRVAKKFEFGGRQYNYRQVQKILGAARKEMIWSDGGRLNGKAQDLFGSFANAVLSNSFVQFLGEKHEEEG